MTTATAHRRALLIVCAALALALVGCGGASTPAGTASHSAGAGGQPSSMPTTGPTATPTPPPLLAWSQVDLPASAIPENGGEEPPSDGFTFSPVNGSVIWACIEPTRGTYEVLRSRYDSTTWQMMSMITPTAPLATTGCFLRADDSDLNSLTASFDWGVPNSPGPVGAVNYFSDDAGATWNRLPSDVSVEETASFGGVTYAALDINNAEEFVVSRTIS